MNRKLSDYVADKLVEAGIRHVFMITGGGAMHLNQSLGRHPDLDCVFNHHEQASAIGAEAYYRLTGRLAAVNVTTGPGGLNTLTGVHGAWTDSLGMLVVSGQVKYPTTVHGSGLPLRQLGDQEADIVSVVSPVTKYAVMVTDPQRIRYHLEKAIWLATHGRPGPCWVDIPIDIQGAQIDPDTLTGFDPAECTGEVPAPSDPALLDEILTRIARARSPVLLAGSGVRLSGRHAEFLQLAERLGIPVVTAWNAHDVMADDHPCYVGRPGTVGDRAGNFAVQSADLLLVLGNRLNIRQVSYNWTRFAPNAFKIWVDIDPLELDKPTVRPDLPVVADLEAFLPALLARNPAGPTAAHRRWLGWCKTRRARYPVFDPACREQTAISPYRFVDALFRQLPAEAVVVAGNGTACVVGFQAARLQAGQRLWTNSGCASMGYDLPAAIGACIGRGRQEVTCLAGDGSLMMNLQELQTMAGNQLPIKLFILNNNGYSSIRQTHENFFGGHIVGAHPGSGVSFPDFGRLAAAFGLPFHRCERPEAIGSALAEVYATTGPVVCEVVLDEHHPFAPKLASRQLPDGRIVSPELDDMAPFLPEAERLANRYDPEGECA